MAKKKTTTRKAAACISADTRILVLHGPDEMVRQEHLSTLRKALTDAHGEVEVFRFEGKSAALAEVFDELRGYSLMMTHKLVIVDEAELFVTRFREPLERYAEATVDHATLVLRAGKWNKGKLDKLIERVGAVIKCEPPTPAQAASWLSKRAKDEHGAMLDTTAASLLVERLGPHLMLLDSEIAKLALMAEGGKITRELIEQAVGRSSDEKAWVMQEPLLRGIVSGSAREPLEMVGELVDLAGHDVVPVMWAVVDLTRKLAVGSMMKRAGESDQAIAKALRLWGPQTGPFLQVVRKLDPSRGSAMLQRALMADRRTKSGGDPRINLEAVCVSLTDN